MFSQASDNNENPFKLPQLKSIFNQNVNLQGFHLNNSAEYSRQITQLQNNHKRSVSLPFSYDQQSGPNIHQLKMAGNNNAAVTSFSHSKRHKSALKQRPGNIGDRVPEKPKIPFPGGFLEKRFYSMDSEELTRQRLKSELQPKGLNNSFNVGIPDKNKKFPPFVFLTPKNIRKAVPPFIERKGSTGGTEVEEGQFPQELKKGDFEIEIQKYDIAIKNKNSNFQSVRDSEPHHDLTPTAPVKYMYNETEAEKFHKLTPRTPKKTIFSERADASKSLSISSKLPAKKKSQFLIENTTHSTLESDDEFLPPHSISELKESISTAIPQPKHSPQQNYLQYLQSQNVVKHATFWDLFKHDDFTKKRRVFQIPSLKKRRNKTIDRENIQVRPIDKQDASLFEFKKEKPNFIKPEISKLINVNPGHRKNALSQQVKNLNFLNMRVDDGFSTPDFSNNSIFDQSFDKDYKLKKRIVDHKVSNSTPGTATQKKRSHQNDNFGPLFKIHYDIFYMNLIYDELKIIRTFGKNSKLKPNQTICLGQSSHSKTLFFDMDETMIGYNEKMDLKLRPFLKIALEKLMKNFDLYVFTAAEEWYAGPILQLIDPDNKYFQGKFFRQHCFEINGYFVKDLRIFQDRNLSDIIIVDNSIISFAFQLNNGIPMYPYQGNPQDNEMISLMRFLMKIHSASDVRIPIYREFKLESFLYN